MFAYLPLRSYGFRFIIQGDFEVPSSRENVDSDKPWNQWLREEIPQLFVEALSVFMVCDCWYSYYCAVSVPSVPSTPFIYFTLIIPYCNLLYSIPFYTDFQRHEPSHQLNRGALEEKRNFHSVYFFNGMYLPYQPSSWHVSIKIYSNATANRSILLARYSLSIEG